MKRFCIFSVLYFCVFTLSANADYKDLGKVSLISPKRVAALSTKCDYRAKILRYNLNGSKSETLTPPLAIETFNGKIGAFSVTLAGLHDLVDSSVLVNPSQLPELYSHQFTSLNIIFDSKDSSRYVVTLGASRNGSDWISDYGNQFGMPALNIKPEAISLEVNC